MALRGCLKSHFPLKAEILDVTHLPQGFAGLFTKIAVGNASHLGRQKFWTYSIPLAKLTISG